MTEITVKNETAGSLAMNVERMGSYLMQMAQLIEQMQVRMDIMEAQQKQISITHADVKGIMTLIRIRADEYCEKYCLTDDGSIRAVRAAMKKSILQRYQVKDLHDVPAIARQAVESQISHWTDIRLVMKRRESLQRSG